MGKHLLLFLLGLSFVVGFLQALTCWDCAILKSDGNCVKGNTTCEAKDDQECALLVVSKGDNILYRIQDCSSRCLNKTLTYPHVTLNFSCCHDQSLCNEF
ncbi:secreted seminal-vesicle Ly-6 protein 1-like [Grammomys surdaster]|uniref:secreted seminal-vesicle Ly-6 protein 1-like n=1 Tax=Grammomys surdaster TaxID=491861 RepID=UPI00109F4844|nr:secreted seminal-vesicle Ly-6 protein 1-like [Grammomys surdaster]